MKQPVFALALLISTASLSGCNNEQTTLNDPYGAGDTGGLPSAAGGVTGANGGSASSSNASTSNLSCQDGKSACGSNCISTDSDVNNCGGCDKKCSAGQRCENSSCQCDSGLDACPSGCVDVSSDAKNCGDCGTVCGEGQVCSNGKCATGCDQDLKQCGSSCVNTATSSSHCGDCNKACSIAGQSCSSGECKCSNGRELCDSTCVDRQSDSNHCGACGNQCGSGSSCENGTCSNNSNSGTGGTSANGGAGGTSSSSSSANSGGSSNAGGSTAAGGATAAGGTTSAGGTSAAAGSTGGPKLGVSGVVVGIDDEGTLGCVQFCEGTTPSEPDVNPDWGYEDGASCIIESTPTGQNNQECTTGEALPTPNRDGLPGVVVKAGDPAELTCVPLCKGTTPSGTDPAWGWEYQASCIIGGTATANCNQACKTGEPLPTASDLPARSGVIDSDACVPLCACEHPCSAEDEAAEKCNPSWGWEYEAGCVMPDTDASNGKPACTTGSTLTYVPPALTGSKKTDGFKVNGGKLLDAYGNEFVIRGVNNPHIWYDVDNQYLAYRALDTIADYKTNTIRVVWETSGSAALLAQVLYRIVELKMIPMVELHDATTDNDNSTSKLQSMANYYVGTDVKKVMQDFRAYLLINIANEWSGSDYQNAYKSAIKTIRDGGLKHTLVIDASGYGQDANSIFSNASALNAADPEKNLLFSVHMYGQYQSAQSVDTVLNQAMTNNVALIVGEFGSTFTGQQVAWTAITSRCQSNKQGYIAWSWKGNDSANAALDMAKDWTGPLTSWGQDIMVNNTNSIQRTATKASIFP